MREGTTCASKARLIDGRLEWETRPLRSTIANGKYRAYGAWVEDLILAKEQIRAGAKKPREAALELQKRVIPKSHVREYIGN